MLAVIVRHRHLLPVPGWPVKASALRAWRADQLPMVAGDRTWMAGR
ncbi:hypothetical protein [Rhizocola hellebori]|nr:hypothetical protein [Rhizocola hellebori]